MTLRFKKILVSLVAFLSLGVAFEDFGNVSITWKLIAISISVCIVLYLSAGSFAKWSKPKSELGFTSTTLSKRYLHKTLSCLFLAILCLISIGVSIIIVDTYTIKIVETSSPNNTTKLRIRGAIPVAKKVSIHIPPREKTKCTIKDASIERADALMLDWDSSNPVLQLSEFIFRQSISLECTPQIDLRSMIIRIEPPQIFALWPKSRLKYNRNIWIIGGVLWVASIALFFVRLYYQ